MDAAKDGLVANRSRLIDLSERCGLPTEDGGASADFSAAMESWDRQSEQRQQGKAEEL